MRKLASIQKIESIDPINGADSIDVATILGWHVVVKKNEFNVGDTVIYIETDSVLPELPEYEFLRKCCYLNKNGFQGFRIKTAKMCGQISQGLVLPINVLSSAQFFEIGKDVTEQLGIVKYDPPIPTSMSGVIKGSFPSFIPKTDEMRIQSVPGVLDRHRGKEFVVTEKLDGSSMTVYLHGDDFGVCSRNLELKYSESNTLWQLATRYDLQGSLEDLGGNLAFQGEIIGPGIQGNKYKLKETEFRIFNIYDINKSCYISHTRMTNMSEDLEYEFPIIVPNLGNVVLDHSIDQLVELSKGRSQLADCQREGIVLRPMIEQTDVELGRLSFKVINPVFLLKNGE